MEASCLSPHFQIVLPAGGDSFYCEVYATRVLVRMVYCPCYYQGLEFNINMRCIFGRGTGTVQKTKPNEGGTPSFGCLFLLPVASACFSFGCHVVLLRFN